MAAVEARSSGRTSGLGYALRGMLELYPRGVKLFALAPLALALVIIPQFLQHVVEIRLGMFEGKEAFKALQFDWTRMTFGYVKVGGLVLAVLAAARFWWMREHGGKWWDLRRLAWGRVAVGAVIFIGVGSLPEPLQGHLGASTYTLVSMAWSIILLPFLFLLFAGIFDDRSTGIDDFVRRSWPWLLLTGLFVVVAFAPSSWLHQMNHAWAMGADPVLVWAIMIFDSLLVGLLAGLTGTAVYLGYAGFAHSVAGGLPPLMSAMGGKRT